MDWVLAILLFLHVGAAIIAYGLTFAFSIIGAMGGQEPQHLNFALRINDRIEERRVLPLALFVGVTGLLVILREGPDVPVGLWLALAIILYVISLVIALFVAVPTTRRLIEATSVPPSAPPTGASPPQGPPPHIAALVKRSQATGLALVGLLVVIIFLMVAQPF
jgi:hypothetical protein